MQFCVIFTEKMKTRGCRILLPPDYSEDENLSDDEEYTLPPKRFLTVEESEDDDHEGDNNEKHVEDFQNLHGTFLN